MTSESFAQGLEKRLDRRFIAINPQFGEHPEHARTSVFCAEVIDPVVRVNAFFCVEESREFAVGNVQFRCQPRDVCSKCPEENIWVALCGQEEGWPPILFGFMDFRALIAVEEVLSLIHI